MKLVYIYFLILCCCSCSPSKEDNTDNLHLYNINRLQTEVDLKKMVDTLVNRAIRENPQDSFIIDFKNRSALVELYLYEITNHLISSIDGHGNLYSETGGLDESYPERYLVKGGKGEEMKVVIDEYYMYLNDLHYAKSTIASNGSESVIYMKDKDHNKKTFTELNFVGKNVLQCLIIIDHLKKQLLLDEMDVIMSYQHANSSSLKH